MQNQLSYYHLSIALSLATKSNEFAGQKAMSLVANSYDFVFHPHINHLFQQRIEPIKQIRLFEINERQRFS
ncbi:MAG: hypothetical protein ACLTGI_02315 [Hoylesella buccalis]